MNERDIGICPECGMNWSAVDAKRSPAQATPPGVAAVSASISNVGEPSATRDETINSTTTGDLSNPPTHYATRIQPIELIDAGQEANMIGYYEGQIIKYVFRWRKGKGLRDLKAASWFLNRLISQNEELVDK